MIDVDVRYADFFAALKRPSTGVCHCWRVTRLDGVEYLFTDHDEGFDVAEAGGDTTGSPTPANVLTFTSANSFAVTATKKGQGLAVDNLSIIGMIDDEDVPTGFSESDVLAELFADATVEIWLCCWTDLAAGLMPLKKGTLGKMDFRTTGFEAEMRGLAERLQRRVHRIFAIECDAVLGDSRCGVTLTGSPGFTRAVTVGNVINNRVFEVDLAEAEGWVQYGLASFIGGANAGLSREIIEHVSAGGSPGTAQITLLIPMPFDVVSGDTLNVSAGCDKTFLTCQAKFDNAVNYRGAHLMPLFEEIADTPNAR
jgi:uncharacterized phage protein (TIGR02218 family)